MTDEELAALHAQLEAVEASTAQTEARYRAIIARQNEPASAEEEALMVYARAAMAHLMRGGAYRVTDNGDGTYTHEWTAQPRDASGEDSQP